jgi:hypothetical protein
MFAFLKRQLKTKTGQFGTALIVGTVANSIFGNPETANTALQIVNNLFTPESGILGMGAMFLRDGNAKKGE